MTAGIRTGFEGVNVSKPDINDIALKMNIMLQGKINVTVPITFAAGATSTTVTLPEGRLGTSTYVGFMPLTPDAANSTGYYATPNANNNTITVTHANTSTTDRNFLLLVIG